MLTKDVYGHTNVPILFYPSIIIIIIVNLIPLAGVLLWDWDIFTIILLYWLEIPVLVIWHCITVIINPLYGWRNIIEMREYSWLIYYVLAFFFIALSAYLKPSIPGIGKSPWDIITFYLLNKKLWIPLTLLLISQVTGLRGKPLPGQPYAENATEADASAISPEEMTVKTAQGTFKIKKIEIPRLNKQVTALDKKIKKEKHLMEHSYIGFMERMGAMFLFVCVGFIAQLVLKFTSLSKSNFEIIFLLLFILAKTIVEVAFYVNKPEP
ncbi:MAG: hypothetical protein A2Y62_19935 [Candidatus Fischerbacteria bacterium RBG_13_37_8]|uniref:Uncharacterized protein n=1 Tax=Candidatus Fischerbacteria bacterium RBG_13_37_8 TaxID=1817863 RepID=A0A1F5VNU9_9BACT|nr:MAG: hypothetical protein A2Y62_19935 [Candidatus Fischerbacteria bacterium RBG_13_37_8]